MNRKWTREEEEWLQEYFAVYSLKTLAAHLGRTEEAVQKHAWKLGVTFDGAREGMNYSEIADALGVSMPTISRWRKQRGMPFYTVRRAKRRYHLIYADAFWRWVGYEGDPALLTRYRRGSILPEPKWLPDMLREAPAAEKHCLPVTAAECALVRDLRRGGMAWEDIGARLGRTVRSVQKMHRPGGWK